MRFQPFKLNNGFGSGIILAATNEACSSKLIQKMEASEMMRKLFVGPNPRSQRTHL